MMVFPWLKPKGKSGPELPAMVPINSLQFISSAPIADTTLPLDEYFCNYRLQAPTRMFIGFQVDVPHSKLEARFDWFSNTGKLADGKAVGIDWTSSNLNHPWFGGSRFIPNTDTCNRPARRQPIQAGLMEASRARCAGDT